MKLIKFIFLSLICFVPFSLQAMDHSKPLMLKDKFYKEHWEQHFLFEDGTFVTAKFLVANFPWPVGKDHGIMIATIVEPDGKRTIIKNGRNLGEWGFSAEKFDLFIHTHRLKSDNEIHDLYVGSKEGNEVSNRVVSKEIPLDHRKYKNKAGYIEASIYLPYMEGEGAWQLFQKKDKTFKRGAGKIQGFASHVVINGRINEVLKSWLRISGLTEADEADKPIPFISAMTYPNGEQDIIVSLKKANGEIVQFSEVMLDYKNIVKEGKKSSYPTLIKATAKNGEESLHGTITFTREIDHFNINDHMNFFERTFAKSRGSVSNYRYVADYDLTYQTAEGSQRLTGQALSEYADILPPKKKKSKRKKRR